MTLLVSDRLHIQKRKSVICFGLHCERYIHHHSTKQGIIKRLTHRCQTICRDNKARRAEQLHLNKVFKSNGYPTGLKHRATNKKIQEPHGQQPSTRICISYIKGIGEQIRKICNRESIQVTFRSHRSLRTILTKVKPLWPNTDIKGVVYRIPCKDCDETYIGETGRTLKLDYKNTSVMLDSDTQPPMRLLTMLTASYIR